MALLDVSPAPVVSRVSVDEDVFESGVLQNPFSVESWLRYIEFKRGSGDVAGRFLLYERALSSIPRSYKLYASCPPRPPSHSPSIDGRRTWSSA